jgi:hypothetical protein
MDIEIPLTRKEKYNQKNKPKKNKKKNNDKKLKFKKEFKELGFKIKSCDNNFNINLKKLGIFINSFEDDYTPYQYFYNKTTGEEYIIEYIYDKVNKNFTQKKLDISKEEIQKFFELKKCNINKILDEKDID